MAFSAFLAGDHEIAVKGIATTAMATMDVLKQATKMTEISLSLTKASTTAKAWLEWSARPGRGQPLGPDDPVFIAKKAFIEKNSMAVFRFRKSMDSAAMRSAGRSSRIRDPIQLPAPWPKFENLVAEVRKRLDIRGGIRVIGDRLAAIHKAALLPGLIAINHGLKRLPEADLFITGEAREWEVAEYALDTVTAVRGKALSCSAVLFPKIPA